MDAQEIHKELNMSYKELLVYLKNKYGLAKENYFLDRACTRKSTKNGRGYEGLELHHDFEYDEKNSLVNNLSNSSLAKQFDYAYQYAENLTYCNYLEHTILHVKINILRTEQLNTYIKDGLVYFLIPNLNSMYKYLVKLKPWQEVGFKLIEDNYSDYCDILDYWLSELIKVSDGEINESTKSELLANLKKLSKIKK